MKNWKRYVLPTVFMVIIIILLIFFTSNTNGPVQEKATMQCYPGIPAEFSFAGELVPLDDPEVRERLDRELIINTYFHSSTIQNIKRSGRYFPIIEPILESKGVPLDFKYLAVAESGLRNSISPANAVGIWQFLESTAREYGLVVNQEVDQRYDIEKSTIAAADYLNKAYERFGSWALAAASYNRGITGIANALQNQSVDQYYDLMLNEETSRYVLRLSAIKAIMENPRKYGYCFEADEIYQVLPYSEIRVTNSIEDLVEFARINNTNLKTLKFYNPWLRTNSLTLENDAFYTIKLPL